MEMTTIYGRKVTKARFSLTLPSVKHTVNFLRCVIDTGFVFAGQYSAIFATTICKQKRYTCKN